MKLHLKNRSLIELPIPINMKLLNISGCCLLAALLIGACNNGNFIPQNGDLLFQVNESNEFTDAITTSTAINTDLPFSHVGIAQVEEGNVFVIEAVPDGGVRKVTLSEFLDGSAHTSGKKPIVVVYRLTRDIDLKKVMGIAEGYIGLPYDSAFQPDDSSFYCSKLVLKSYTDTEGNPVFTSKPMSFKDSTGNISALWREYFKKLNKKVPEGSPGTNPYDMSQENVIREVYRYF